MFKFSVTLPVIVSCFVLVVGVLKYGDDGVCLRAGKKITDCDTRKPTCKLFKCCTDWLYDRNLGKCVPVCLHGCLNGTCIGPGKCSCEAPLTLVGNACVPPVCDPPCHNGNCINNTCQCLPSFHPHNTTHCYPSCEPGYKNDPEECRPYCESPCKNGECITQLGSAPNNCSCNEDYRPDPHDKFNCLPICEPECENGFCVSPYNCSCNPGHKHVSKWSCKLTCDSCLNGDCVAPPECKCKDGYEMKKGKCVAKCDKPCVNGNCSKPNECSCDTGFKQDPHDKLLCLAICSKECINSSCVNPDKCECLPGYVNTEHENICKPSCKSCEYGTCVAGDCLCRDGFKKINGTCILIETVSCEICNGNCTSTECSCADGTPCIPPLNTPDKSTNPPSSLAGLQLNWVLGAALGFLLVVFVLVVMQRLWSKSNNIMKKQQPNEGITTEGSVMYSTVLPNTLISSRMEPMDERYEQVLNAPQPSDALLEDHMKA